MQSNTALSVTGLDFDSIRSNLQAFIEGKAEFSDFNFDDSAIGTLLDLLAFNTYYGAFYANMAVNESFLDSAQLYESVVSHAKKLGYNPRSAHGAAANLHIVFNTAIATDLKRTLLISQNTEFTATVNGISYAFVTPKSFTFSANSTDGFQGDIEVIEGIVIQHDFVYSVANTEFVLDNDAVDTRSISVEVNTNGNIVPFNLASDLKDVTSDSNIFFVEPDRNKRYKVLFGDGVMGNKPAVGSIATINYRVSSGVLPNGAALFASTEVIDGENDFTITANHPAIGGAGPETIEAIRFNAPRSFETQNRAVTTSDYERIILRDNPTIESARVWGGEENDPPIYGKVFCAVNPRIGTLISTTEKNKIKRALDEFNVQSIDIEFVDPAYLYINPHIVVRYDSAATSQQGSDIAAKVAAKVAEYEVRELNTFAGSFRYSRFLDDIDSADTSIVGSQADILLEKRFIPQSSPSQNYTINFNHTLKHTREGFLWAISSNAFTQSGVAQVACFLDDDGFGNVRIFFIQANERIYVQTQAGTVDYTTGKIKLINFNARGFGDNFSIVAALSSFDVSPVRNQILLIAGTTIDVFNDATGLREARIVGTTLGTSLTFQDTNLLTLTNF